MDEGSWCCTIHKKDHPQEKEVQKEKKKYLSEEVIHITEKRRKAKGKGEKEMYIHLNVEFQKKKKK